MERSAKASAVEDLQGLFANVSSFVVAHYHGLTVNQIQQLRKTLRDSGAAVQVVKNSLARRALVDTIHSPGVNLFSGPCALGYCPDDPTVVPRVMKKFKAEYDSLSIVGGMMNGVVLSATQVEELADLPSLEVLRGKLLGLVNAPAQRLVSIITQPGAGIARVVNAHVEASAS